MSPVPARCLALALAAAASTSCAYYNGMYNAKRYARLAERSERAGRTAEARSRWQESATHAESVLARHPRSRWADDALLLDGRALVHLERHHEAARALRLAAERAQSGEQRLEALLWLGRSELALGRLDSAGAALDEAAGSAERSRHSTALLLRGRVMMARGDAARSIPDFERSGHPEARFELARALVVVRDTARAARLLDTLAAGRAYRESYWLPLLDSLAAAGALARAGELGTRLAARADLAPGQRARLLLDEAGRRLARADSARAETLLRDAIRLAPDSVEAREAGLRLLRLALARTTTVPGADSLRDSLLAVARGGGAPAREAGAIIRILDLIREPGAGAIFPDANWFWVSELARDSLASPRLAASLFVEMADSFPESPWTPKALLAAIHLGTPEADSLRAVLETVYHDSPYMAALRGEPSPAFAAVEDTLRLLLARRASAPATRPRTDAELEIRPRTRLQPERPPTQPARPRPPPAATPPPPARSERAPGLPPAPTP